ncbi:MAG: diphthine--ammonia ligase [Candidatus Altiarchaeales archaeon]|nr:diphthine--ammonia ligase [Candidatus Altiarchaeales archaeon]
MRLGCLFSGGKDSAYAVELALSEHEVVCLITLDSVNPESYMYHTPNVELTRLQAQAIGLPQIIWGTEGVEEVELTDLRSALVEAKEKHRIEGVVSGAIESVYQASRVQRICDELGLWSFNPLWLKDQEKLMRELIEKKYEVIVSGVFAYPLGEDFLGRRVDEDFLGEMIGFREQYGLNVSGEGGEIETTVLDAPFFGGRIRITGASCRWMGDSGVYVIEGAGLVEK